MYADDLPLDRLSGFSFFKHHDSLCRYGGRNCTERTLHKMQTGARILAHLLASDVHHMDANLMRSPIPKTRGQSFDEAVSGLNFVFEKADVFSDLKLPTSEAKSVLLGAFSLLASGQKQAAQQLVWQSMTRKRFNKAFFQIVTTHFGLPAITFD
jgi:hypothetical protein